MTICDHISHICDHISHIKIERDFELCLESLGTNTFSNFGRIRWIGNIALFIFATKIVFTNSERIWFVQINTDIRILSWDTCVKCLFAFDQVAVVNVFNYRSAYARKITFPPSRKGTPLLKPFSHFLFLVDFFSFFPFLVDFS